MILHETILNTLGPNGMMYAAWDVYLMGMRLTRNYLALEMKNWVKANG